ncbi:TlpA family protein disulfide reductase [Chitinophaga arvensicola]|uniref:Thiol-disulfide isomerase or thioredoxin n=1 Tax=Chitinophaga arvensicola TaxID=29529 RepID=A0A1I0SB16_9BACT|nr:TlpA disulfide reductase family protein [Chitinophaga arvensicola]SEW53836.1 Thiol-disulfide isomerase or thioredoxin [Chitinophaga arvensicola]
MNHIRSKKYQPVILIMALATFLLSFKYVGNPPVFELSGIIKDADNIEVKLVRDVYGDAQELARDTIRQGHFHLQCPVKEVMNVSLVYHRGRDMYSYPVIVEKGKATFKLLPTGLSQVTGTKYNNWVLGYQRDTAYINADKILWQYKHPGAADKKDEEWKMIELFMHHFDIRSRYLQKVLNNGKDPSAAVMAAILLELEPDRAKTMTIVDAAAKQLGDSSMLIRTARKQNAAQEATIARRQGKMINEPFVDFTLPAVNGDMIRLGDRVKAGKFTLLQFWASWCVPCRAEIPLLKELYASYHSKGLEIVSFSMDNNRTAWLKASEKEQMSWANVSDLMADKSPVVKSYPVMGIPANVIIDQQGKIVSSNLIGTDLEEKIKSLFR